MGAGVAVTAVDGPRRAGVALVAAVAALALPRPSAGQETTERRITFTPRPDRPVERRLARFLDRGGYRLWERDTTLARGDTVAGDLLILESMARVEGHVEGTVMAVDADVFLRPGATVAGDLVVLGGGLYRSSMATVEGEVTDRPALLLQAVPREGGYAIYSRVDRPDPVRLDGLSGLHLPTAQRVDGWTLAAGGRLQAVGVGWQPSLDASGAFRTGGGRLAGTVGQYWFPSARWRLGVEGGRATRSNERWIRSDAANTLTYLFGGDDSRNYHESDRALAVARFETRGGDAVALDAGWERIRPLPARGAGGLFGDETVEPNPAVTAGDAWRVGLTGRLRREARLDSLALDLRLEGADASVAGDFSYLYGEAAAHWRLPAALDHRVVLEARARGDLAGELPTHRWSAAGGAGTLPTVDLLELRGPRLAFGRATYVIPLPVLRVPRLGGLELMLRGAAARVWGGGPDRDWHENLIAGARFLAFEGGVAWDPGGDPGEEVRGFFTVSLPR